jgi:uncharacterized membrane protein YfcA
VPLFATVVDGRMIAGTVVPVLMVADLFALRWYHQHARWDLLRRLGIWIALGYAFGIAFFVVVGSATRRIEVVIGVIVIGIVALQIWRMCRGAPQRPATVTTAAIYGTTGGFTSFVANAAGPIINTYLVGLGLPKYQLIGTTAWLYFMVNLAKIPFYLALGEWSSGGRFFTRESLLFDLALVPAVVAGVYSGRAVFHRIPQRAFLIVVLVLSAGGALKLVT